jgi:hypothetical protein
MTPVVYLELHKMSTPFLEKLEMEQRGKAGSRKMIHEKNGIKKSRNTVSLTVLLQGLYPRF